MRDVYPMLTALGKKIYWSFKDEFVDLAMDLNDIIQESYLYYLDFEKRFADKFREDIRWSAIRQYVIWKLTEKIYNFRNKNVKLISLDTELNSYFEEWRREELLDKKILQNHNIDIKKKCLFDNGIDLSKALLKANPKFSFDTIKNMLGKKKFNIFMAVLENKETNVAIGKKNKCSGQYVKKVYNKSLKKIKLRFVE